MNENYNPTLNSGVERRDPKMRRGWRHVAGPLQHLVAQGDRLVARGQQLHAGHRGGGGLTATAASVAALGRNRHPHAWNKEYFIVAVNNGVA